ncbi:hypermethylated in cancer 1 protein-like isoform X47 [Branchiostoma floridae]|uniref:Hypermethylated in cancer 1 protein-like isoform X47 n=1 Tax=Branchiostoma floridae TaxID=7739 RepID=A0A9J7M9H8_BRAFL|nr:hypermethylated in cancer 1 protein-like isoform X47 [Branchiostoma floridae]
MRQKQAPLRIEDDIESEDITMAAAATEDFHRESGDGLCGDFSCPHCAFSVDQDVMLKVLKHFFNCTSLQYIIDLSVGNAASLGAAKHSAPRRASKAPQPHSEPVRHAEPPTKRRATEARATPPQESPRIVTTQAPTLLARLNAAQSRTQTVSQREIPPEPEHHTRPRQVETVQPRAPETTTTTTTSAASVELPSITTIKEEPGAGAACIVEPTAPTLFDDPMHTQKDTDSAMGMKRDTDNVGSMLDALPGTSSSGLFSEDLNFGGAGPSFVQSDPSQEDSTSGNGCHKTRTGLLEETRGGPLPWQHYISRPEPPTCHVSEGPRDHLCITCGKTFDSHQMLVSHVQLHHQLPSSYSTELPGDSHPGATASSGSESAGPGYPAKYGNPEGTLEEHQTFHTSADAARHAKLQRQKRECSICGVELSNKYNHDRHVKLKHSNLRDFVCTWCGKSFKLREHLQRHMQKNHMPMP